VRDPWHVACKPEVVHDRSHNEAAQPGLPAGSLPFALAALAAALTLTVSLWSNVSERRALLRMSPEVRERVYAGALANLKELCPAGSGSPAFESRCSEQATFLAQFPECDAACRGLLRPHLPTPTR